MALLQVITAPDPRLKRKSKPVARVDDRIRRLMGDMLESMYAEEGVVCNEGCLSLPEQYAEVERPAEIRLRYLDEHGEIREREARGLLSTCIQHEIDHLEGVLFVDHVSALKRGIILRKLAKAKRLQTPVPA